MFSRRPKPPHCGSPRFPLKAVALTLGALAAIDGAAAQQQLPGIVVQGATLESPPRSRSQAAPSDGQGVSGEQQPASADAAAADTAGGSAGIAAEKLGTSVTVITGAQLKAQQIRSAGEALRSLPGVSVGRTGGAAGLTQVRIRGAEANHTLVLIDGVEANASTDGEFDFSDLLAEDIERIEVIRGPQSALYGSNAVGGVINILTRGGQGPLTITARAEHGAFNTQDGAVRVSGGNDRAWGALTVHHQRSNGFNVAPGGALDEEDGHRLTTIAAKAGFMLADNVRLGLSLRNTDKRLDRDDQTGLDSRGGFVTASDSFSHSASSVLLMGADLRWDMLDGALTHVFKATRNVTDRDDTQIANFGFGFGPPSLFVNTSEAVKFGYSATYRFATPMLLAARHSLTGLVEREREDFEVDSQFGGFVSAARARTGVASEWRGEFFDRVYLSAGVRHDDNDSVKDFTTWRTGVSVPFREIGVRPHASVGTAVKLPTLFEQFGSTSNFVSNPNLLPEESFGWDAGVEMTLFGGKAVLDVTYFAADLKNKIRTDFLVVGCNPGDLFCAFPINVPGTSKREGIEVTGRFLLLPGVTLGLGYTYLDAVDGAGVQELRRPPHAARADLTYAFDGGRGLFNVAAVYNGETKDVVFGAPFFFPVQRLALDDYWLLSAAASYKVQPGVELYGRVENLLDQHYEEIFGFNTAGLAAYAGVRFTFEDRSTSVVAAAK